MLTPLRQGLRRDRYHALSHLKVQYVSHYVNTALAFLQFAE